MSFDLIKAKKLQIFLVKNGMTMQGACGLIANLQHESGLSSTNLENAYNNKFGMNDIQYTYAVDNGSYSQFVGDSAGYGLAQWTFYARKQALLDFAQAKRKSIGDFDMQMEFLLKELKTNYKAVYNLLCSSTNLDECTRYVMIHFERPLNQSESAQMGRVQTAKSIYEGVTHKALNEPVSSPKMQSGINTYKKGVPVQISRNFKSTEFDCQGKGCCSETPIDAQLVDIIQKVRDHFGVPVNINCGYRCSVHNAQVSGASKTSQHMTGKAGDIVVKGVHPVRVARYIETISGYKGMIGCYTWDDTGKGFVHVDTRGTDYRGIYTEDNAHCDYIKSFSVEIGRGSSGRIVKVIQRRLTSMGLYNGAIDGKCGDQTVKAIRDVNLIGGRQNDYIWGAKCWEENFPAKKI